LTVIIRPSGWAWKESFMSSGLQPDHRQSFVDVYA
jgi:hypothetical protein